MLYRPATPDSPGATLAEEDSEGSLLLCLEISCERKCTVKGNGNSSGSDVKRISKVFTNEQNRVGLRHP